MSEESRYFRRGLGNRDAVIGTLHADYHSGLIEFLRANGHRLQHGDTTLHLAREFGFCYGVDRAVAYAYETRERFPNRRTWLVGEIIHNPGVNRRLGEMGVRFLPAAGTVPDHLAEVQAGDVVVIPAFGVPYADFTRLRERGCVLVDTTCGSVLTVWKSVEKFARSGITAIIHGKYDHEETRATCSQVTRHPGAHFLVVRDRVEAEEVCAFLEGSLNRAAFLARFARAASPGFDPDLHLERIGCANQTTMLSSESLEIAGLLRAAMVLRHGEKAAAERVYSFDTICSATQERQDAVLELVAGGCGLMVVIGGFNSSNTNHLVEIASATTRTYHIEDAANLVSPRWIRHQPRGERSPLVEEGWLPAGPLIIGVTAGASTPDSEIGASIERLLRFRGMPEAAVGEVAMEGRRIAESRRLRERERTPPKGPPKGTDPR
jgi:4-hydroxy-3-methylbut-2-en-1-yl diphosphate reductase